MVIKNQKLQKSKRNLNKLYVCKVCDKKYARKGNLDKHKCIGAPLKKNSNKIQYECSFCLKKFKYESGILKHQCEAMHRNMLMKTLTGEVAWQFYKTWMKLRNSRVYKKNLFVKSKYFNAFINFRKYSIKVGIPDTGLYIKYMISKLYSPSMWIMDDVYGEYVTYLDSMVDPITNVKISITTLDSLADSLDCAIEEVFNEILPGEVILLLRQRKLSPWLLIHSPKFHKFVKTATKEQERILRSYVSPGVWQQKLNKISPKKRELIRKLVRALNL